MNDSYQHSNSRWLVLAVLAVAQFMVVLDVTIVNVALPAIQTDLGFSVDGLQWVVNAYTLAFGGLLLLGGRASDLLGRRRVFLAGLALFAAASLAGGLATSPEMLIAVRAVQGIGAALLSPAALALLTVTFPAGRDRNVALGVWGALAGHRRHAGRRRRRRARRRGRLGVDLLRQRPVRASLGLFATPRIVAESRRAGGQGFDLTGAVLASTGLLALVYAIIRTDAAGWSSAEVLGLLGAAVALLAAFVVVESRASDPLVPLDLFRTRGLSVSAIALGLNGAAFLGMFFITALYLQQVHGDSALDAGVHFLPMGVAAIASAVVGAQLVTRIGTRAVYVAGSAIGVVGLLLLGRAGAGAGYGADLLPGLVVFGLGLPLVGVSNQIAAVAEVPHEQAGAASGIVTSAFQIGGAAGLALVSSAATSRVGDALAAGAAQPDALAAGFQRGMLVVAGLAVANLLIGAIRAPRITPDAALVAEAAAA